MKNQKEYIVKKEKDGDGEPIAVLYKNVDGKKVRVHSVDLYSNYSFIEAKRDLLRANK